MEYGAWSVGVWSMEYGVWSMEYEQWRVKYQKCEAHTWSPTRNTLCVMLLVACAVPCAGCFWYLDAVLRISYFVLDSYLNALRPYFFLRCALCVVLHLYILIFFMLCTLWSTYCVVLHPYILLFLLRFLRPALHFRPPSFYFALSTPLPTTRSLLPAS